MAKKKPRLAGDPPQPSISAAGSSQQQTTGGSALMRRPQAAPAPKKRPARRVGSSSSGGSTAPAGAADPTMGQVRGQQDPLAPMSMADMIAQATQVAQASIQPQVNQVNQDAATAQSAHDTRAQQLQQWAGWEQGNLDNAFSNTRDALNQLVTLQGGVDQSSKDALATALRGSTGSTDQAAAQLGTASPTNLTPVLDSSADSAKSMQLGAGSGAGALLGLMGANRTLPSVGLSQNQEVERQRYNAESQGFQKQRNDLLGTVPGLVQGNLKDQQQFELAKSQFGEQKANDLFQQYLSEQELGLKKKDQSFQQWLATAQVTGVDPKTGLPTEEARANKANEGLTAAGQKAQNAIDWANVGINRTQAEGALAQIKADATKEKDAKKKDQLQARGDAMAKGLEWLSGYMAPQKGEAKGTKSQYPYGAATSVTVDDPSTTLDESDPKQNPKYTASATEYKRTFDDALRGLTNYMSRSDALRILMKSEYGDWRKRASSYYNRMKRRPGSGASGYPDKGGAGAGA